MTILVEQVMKKVRTIFLLRRLVLPCLFSIAAALVVASTVSISHVIANMPSFSPTLADISAFAQFFAGAFAHTDVVVKCALVAGTLFLLMTLKGIVDSFRLVGYSASMQKAQ